MTKEHVVLDDGYEAYLFTPAGTPKSGCIIVFHERYGLVKHTLDIGERLAAAGYTVLTPDLFSLWPGDKAALARGDARAIIADDECTTQLDRWIDYIRHHPARPECQDIVLFGVCQSGRYPIVVASRRDDVKACVVFYGAANDRDWTTSPLQPVSMAEMVARLVVPMFFVFAERDHTISIDHVSRLRGCLEAADVSYRMRVMADMPHGFLNDTMPGRYRPEQAAIAWTELLAFLAAVLEDQWPHGRVEWDLHSVKNRHYDFTKNKRLA